MQGLREHACIHGQVSWLDKPRLVQSCTPTASRSSRILTLPNPSRRRRAMIAAPLVLGPLLGLSIDAQAASNAAPADKVAPGSYTPMEALKDKDYGKARLK